jgi:xylulokinase
MKYLLGVDAGTTSFKGILIDEEGKIISIANQPYELITPSNNMIEFEVEKYWEVFKKVVAKLIKDSGVKPDKIVGLAIDSQGETLICLDKDSSPLRNAIVWMDNRSTVEAELIREEFGLKQVYDVTGQPELTATWPATKILWLRRNQKEIFDKTSKYLLLEDYLIYRLTGKFYCEKSLISSSLYYDIHNGKWWDSMLDFIGISQDKLPIIEESGVAVGNLTDDACRETGLDKDTIIVTGAFDQISGVIGAGAIHDSDICETTGTALAMCASIKTPPPFNENFKVPCQGHAIKGKYFLLFWAQTAGIILKWFRDNFVSYDDLGNSSIYARMDKDATKVPAGSDGLILLPHLSGAACPEFNPYAKGIFYGITLKHTREYFIRAVLESIGYMLKEQIETAESLGIKINEIRSLGGGAVSSVWNNIKTNITGKPIITLENEETAVTGAAILAGVGTGVFDSIESACSKGSAIKDRFYPEDNLVEAYLKPYEKYKKLYKALEPLFREE